MKDESIEERAKTYAIPMPHTRESIYAAILKAFIAGAESQDALRSEEVENYKKFYNERIEVLVNRLSSLTAIADKMEVQLRTMLQYYTDEVNIRNKKICIESDEALAEYQSFKTTKQ